MARILMSPPDVGDLEAKYAVEAIHSGWVAPLGPQVDAFEREMCERVGVGHAVALSSGTAALHLALLAWGVGPGVTVVAPTMTFAATINAIAYTGADVHLVDCELTTGNLDPALLDEALDELAAAGTTVAVVVTVDLLGKCCDYERLNHVAGKHGARLLADSCESVGASSQGVPAGALGDAATFSFNGNKIMTTSGGGMLLSEDAEVVARARHLATQARQPAVHYEHTEVGYNYRLSNILAAVGRAQLARLDEMIERRRELRDAYTSLVGDIDGVAVLGGDDDAEDNCWLSALVVEKESGRSAGSLMAALAAADIEARPLWKPMHLQPVFAEVSATVTGAAEHLFRHGVTLPSGSGMTDVQLRRVLDAVEGWLDADV
jgi:dTDP-4-amino-4,6-dideoxygalactose transaminase